MACNTGNMNHAATVTNRATSIFASALAGTISLAGVLHGFMEFLQGGATPDGPVVNAIGPGQRLWEFATLHAFTIAPSMVLSGCLAMTIGLLAAVWAFAFLERKSGPGIMLLLSLALFLVGGGFGPLFNGGFACLVATGAHSPLEWWRAHIPPAARKILSKFWPGIPIAYLLLFLFSVETAVCGKPLTWLLTPETVNALVLNAGSVMLLFMLASALSALARDLGAPHHSQTDTRP